MKETYDKKVIESIVSRAHYLTNQIIFQANQRKNKSKGDPKVGGHSASSSSSIHILGALHLILKTGFDHIANKPHASPADHSYNYLMKLFLNNNLERFNEDEANNAMMGLRAYSENGSPVFQSYHSVHDPDHHNFLPSGSVGIPPVNAGYLALAYRLAKKQGHHVPEAHFWSIMGDSEFREGSLLEAAPDFAERELGNLTWIIDYNRQSLDGHRITNSEIMKGNDNNRIENTLLANGWDVIQVRHGELRRSLFKKTGGKNFQHWLDNEVSDYELQSLLCLSRGKEIKQYLKKKVPAFMSFLKNVTDDELYRGLRNFGGHDINSLADSLRKSKENPRKPCLVIAHTIKGWNLKMAAASGNHSFLPSKEEMDQIQKTQGLKKIFENFPENSDEGKFLKDRSEKLFKEILEQDKIKKENESLFRKKLKSFKSADSSLNINLKMASYPHTQWMLGQLTAKLTRIANTDENQLDPQKKPLNEEEKLWKTPAELIFSMAPDVGTSTNLNPTMDGKIFGAEVTKDIENELSVKDKKQPDLVPKQGDAQRFLRFEIAEANSMSCAGSFGKIKDILGIPFLPLMTIYDFFIKRALDQHFYNLYWNSGFILVGTPSGVTLSSEGAQHCWKSDIQVPNQITWEPFYCIELEWIFCESVKRHMLGDNEKRQGVLIRGVTRGINQKEMIKFLRRHKKYKSESIENLFMEGFELNKGINESEVRALDDDVIFQKVKEQVLKGAYFLIDYRGYCGYEPGDNVINIFSMGSPTTEAIKASEELLSHGIYANVIVVTSPDLLLGNQAFENNYNHLKNELNITAKLFLKSSESYSQNEARTFSGRRVPIVSVHDGEPGLLDNIGSIVGVKQEALAVRKHSKCGRPSDIYTYHGLDSDSVIKACKKVLLETALEEIQIV